MKKAISLTLAIILLALSGCSGFTKPEQSDKTEVPKSEPTSFTSTIETTQRTETTSTARITNEAQNAEKVQTEVNGIFRLGQSPEELLDVFKAEGIKPIGRMNEGGRIVELDGTFWYDSKDVRAIFNPEGQLVTLTVLTPRYATDLGIRVGDSKEKMVEAYGDNYTNDESEGFWCFYSYGDLCIGFLVYDVIEWWRIFIPSDQPSPP